MQGINTSRCVSSSELGVGSEGVESRARRFKESLGSSESHVRKFQEHLGTNRSRLSRFRCGMDGDTLEEVIKKACDLFKENLCLKHDNRILEDQVEDLEEETVSLAKRLEKSMWSRRSVKKDSVKGE